MFVGLLFAPFFISSMFFCFFFCVLWNYIVSTGYMAHLPKRKYTWRYKTTGVKFNHIRWLWCLLNIMMTTYDLWQTKWYAGDQLIYEINGEKIACIACLLTPPSISIATMLGSRFSNSCWLCMSVCWFCELLKVDATSDSSRKFVFIELAFRPLVLGIDLLAYRISSDKSTLFFFFCAHSDPHR